LANGDWRLANGDWRLAISSERWLGTYSGWQTYVLVARKAKHKHRQRVEEFEFEHADPQSAGDGGIWKVVRNGLVVEGVVDDDVSQVRD
jgi:hypothetical protein